MIAPSVVPFLLLNIALLLMAAGVVLIYEEWHSEMPPPVDVKSRLGEVPAHRSSLVDRSTGRQNVQERICLNMQERVYGRIEQGQIHAPPPSLTVGTEVFDWSLEENGKVWRDK